MQLLSHRDPGCVASAPRHTPLWSLLFSTVHLSSVSSSLGLPSFLGFSEQWKVEESCYLSPGLQGAGGSGGRPALGQGGQGSGLQGVQGSGLWGREAQGIGGQACTGGRPAGGGWALG